MRRIRERLARRKSDSAESNTIAFLFISLVLLVITITVIDMGLYFLNRNTITNAATNGARIAAVYGGTESVIAKEMGMQPDDFEVCAKKGGKNVNPVSCAVGQNLLNNKGLVTVKIDSIDCGPEKTHLGGDVYCKVSWRYAHLPLSLMTPADGKASKHVASSAASSEVETLGQGDE